MESPIPPAGPQERPLRRALVVDDKPASADVCRAFLRQVPSWAMEVDVELRSFKAIERLGRERFDLVVTELQMPEYSGAEVIAAARAADASTRCILVTGHEHAMLSGLPERGVDGLLTKPLRLDALVPLADRLLARDAVYALGAPSV